MANIKQQKKRVKQDAKRKQSNQIFKSGMKTSVKKVEKLVAEGNKEEAQKAFDLANKKLDKALTKGIYHKNKVARKKSQLQQMINEL